MLIYVDIKQLHSVKHWTCEPQDPILSLRKCRRAGPNPVSDRRRNRQKWFVLLILQENQQKLQAPKPKNFLPLLPCWNSTHILLRFLQVPNHPSQKHQDTWYFYSELGANPSPQPLHITPHLTQHPTNTVDVPSSAKREPRRAVPPSHFPRSEAATRHAKATRRSMVVLVCRV